MHEKRTGRSTTTARRRWLVLLAASIAFGLVVAWWWPIDQPPRVADQNLKYVQLLRTAVSSRRADVVERFAVLVDQRLAEQVMSDAEVEHFRQILAVAQRADWPAADRMAHAFESAQAN
jgi:hypothetical protein